MDNPRPNYATACLAVATPRKKHMDASISADKSELFEAQSDINASLRIKALTESPIPAESEPRKSKVSELYEGKIHCPKSTQEGLRRSTRSTYSCSWPSAWYNNKGKGLWHQSCSMICNIGVIWHVIYVMTYVTLCTLWCNQSCNEFSHSCNYLGFYMILHDTFHLQYMKRKISTALM